jgi:hypothetical protein
LPLTSTIGGFPGEKNKSLIFGAARNIAASRLGTENAAGAGAAAVATGAPCAGTGAGCEGAGAGFAAGIPGFTTLPDGALLEDDIKTSDENESCAKILNVSEARE